MRRILALLAFAGAAGAAGAAQPEGLGDLRKAFDAPPREFAPIPWWIWNDDLNADLLVRQIREMEANRVPGFMMYAMYGLTTPYLSDRYFERVRTVVEQAAKSGMHVWAMDEWAWPSGSAGGRVAGSNPLYRCRALSLFEFEAGSGAPVELKIAPGDDPRIERVLAARRQGSGIALDSVTDVTARLKGSRLEWTPPPGEWRILALVSRDYRDFIDSMNPAAVRAFIDSTHEKYREALGPHFGKTFKGFMLDEPRYIRFGGGKPQWSERTIPWTLNFFDRLREYGVAHPNRALAAVFYDAGPEGARQRAGFWSALSRMYASAYFEQLGGWARKHGIEYTGHSFEEETHWLPYVGDYLGTMRHLSVPGIDQLGMPGADSPTPRKNPKLASSAAHGWGSARAFMEAPNLIGYGMTLQQMKYVTDWAYAYGVNLQAPGAMLMTRSHNRLYGSPSVGYQWSLWPYYGRYCDYVTRLGAVLTRGRHAADVAVFYPTTSMWKNFNPQTPGDGQGNTYKRMGPEGRFVLDGVNDVAQALMTRQIEFDFVDEPMLARASVAGGKLRLNAEEFSTIVIPPTTMLRPEAVRTLREFARAGGKIVAVGLLPEETVDGTGAIAAWVKETWGRDPAESNRQALAGDAPMALERRGAHTFLSAGPAPEGSKTAYREKLAAALVPALTPDALIEAPRRDRFALHRRRAGNAEIFFLASLHDKPQDAAIKLPVEGYAEIWDVPTGERRAIPGAPGDGFRHAFAPFESIVVVVDRSRPAAPAAAGPRPQRAAIPGPWRFELATENYLPLNQGAMKREITDPRAWLAAETHVFTYTVEAAGPVAKLKLVLDDLPAFSSERGLASGKLVVKINGVDAPLRRSTSIDWKLIEADLSGKLRAGSNEIVVEYEHQDYNQSWDLMRKDLRIPSFPTVPKAVLAGAFRLGGGKLHDGASHAMPLESWTGHGYPYLSGAGVYSAEFDARGGEKFLELTRVADAAELEINGKPAGPRLFAPYRWDISKLTVPGRNRVRIKVTNSQHNFGFEKPVDSGLLGPVEIVRQ